MALRKGKKVNGTTIYTDNKWKQFKYRDEVPKKVLKDDFDWLDEDDGFDGFFKYKGTWYHLSMFMNGGGFPGWDGYHGDSFFSGVLIALSPDGEEYKVATYIS